MSSHSTTIGGRLKEERSRLALSQEECAQRCGVSRSSQVKYEGNERKPDAEYLELLGHAGGDVGYVVLGRRTSQVDNAIGYGLNERPASGFVTLNDDRADYAIRGLLPNGETPPVIQWVPLYDVTVSGGHGAQPNDDQQVLGWYAFLLSWIRDNGWDPRYLGLIKVAGRSMHPDIQDGELVLVDLRKKELGREGIYVIELNGQWYCKLVQRAPNNAVYIKSRDPDFETIHVEGGDVQDLLVMGQAVWAGPGRKL